AYHGDGESAILTTPSEFGEMWGAPDPPVRRQDRWVRWGGMRGAADRFGTSPNARRSSDSEGTTFAAATTPRWSTKCSASSCATTCVASSFRKSSWGLRLRSGTRKQRGRG